LDAIEPTRCAPYGDSIVLQSVPDDYYQSGQANAVVLVDSAGSLVGAYALTELLLQDEISALERSDCGCVSRAASVMEQPFADEQVVPRATSLRFSSITDVARRR
jgi:hypothetical protein